MKDKILAAGVPIIKEWERFYRRDRKTGMIKSYADPASPLGKAIQRAGKWQAYLDDLWSPPMSMSQMSGVPWTIGWGTTGPDVGPNTVWSESKCNQRFEEHLTKFLNSLLRIVGSYGLNANQLGACLSLMYNIGEGNFETSTLVRKIRARDFAGAAEQFPRWNKARGKVMSGLVKRRAQERALFLGEDA